MFSKINAWFFSYFTKKACILYFGALHLIGFIPIYCNKDCRCAAPFYSGRAAKIFVDTIIPHL